MYWGNGSQIIPPHDTHIAAAIEAQQQLWPLPPLNSVPLCAGLSDPTNRVEQQYYERLAKLRYRPRVTNAAAQPVVYTPLHGVGLEPVQRAFQVCSTCVVHH